MNWVISPLWSCPRSAAVVKQFGVLGSIESVKAASDIFAPVSGKVIKVNDALETTPEMVNESAEDAGWMAGSKSPMRRN